MQVICEEEWEVSTGKETFVLSPQQFELLKKAMESGQRGMIFFKDFGISIPHISHTKLRRREHYKLEGGVKLKISSGQYEELSKKLLHN